MTLTTLFIFSIPEAVALCCLCTFLSSVRLKQSKKTIITFAILWASLTYLFWQIDINPLLRMGVQLPFLFIMGYYFFRLPMLKTFLFFSLGYLLLIASELTGYAFLQLLNINLQEFFQSEVNKAIFGIKNLLLILICFWFNQREIRFHPGQSLKKLFAQKNKVTLIFLTLVILQLILVSILNVSIQMFKITNTAWISGISISLAVLLLVSIYYIKYIRDIFTKDWEDKTSILLNENVNQLFTELRSQRHDFQNHLQTLQGLIYLNKFDQAKEYVLEVGKELKGINQYMSSNPILSSILLSKAIQYREQGVHLDVRIEDNLESLSFNSIHLIHMVGNLLDNAKDAVLSCADLEPKVVYFSSKRAPGTVILEVKNQQPIIPKHFMNRMMEKGFSTKGTDGLGLPIVNENVQKYHGTLQVISNPKTGTIFTLTFPIHSTAASLSTSTLHSKSNALEDTR